ncbi:MAG TPA: histidine kinase, partial [Massilia sp.]|nr:histidine kinase [Massilia sp.]
MRSSSSAVPIDPPRPVQARGVDSLMEAAGDVVFRVAPSGEIRQASRRAERTIGLPFALEGRLLTGIVSEFDQAALRTAFVDVQAADEPVLVRTRLKCAGRDTWFELRIATCADEDGRDDSLLVVGRDMSAQYATE